MVICFGIGSNPVASANFFLMSTEAIAPQDIAMSEFRQFFQVPLSRCTVSEDGTKMRYTIMSDRLAAECWLMAQRIIHSNNLPLIAEIDEWVMAGILFDRCLMISFAPQLEPLPCY